MPPVKPVWVDLFGSIRQTSFPLTCTLTWFHWFFFPSYDTTLADACIALAQRWIKVSPRNCKDLFIWLFLWSKSIYCALLSNQAKDHDLDTFKEADMKMLSSHQIIEFLSLLLHEVNHLTSLTLPSFHFTPTDLLFALLGSSSSDSCEEDARGLWSQYLYELRDPLQVSPTSDPLF